MFDWLKIPDSYYLARPEDFDASKLSWAQLREQLNDFSRMELHYAAENVTEILKRIMDRLDKRSAE